MESQTKTCQNCKAQFVIDDDETAFYTKMDIPVPELCPDCRQQRRILFRNFKTLYKSVSAKSGKSMISMYPPETRFPVWSSSEWWADDWDPKGFGRDYDFNKPFFQQLADLWRIVPRYGIMNTKSTNCEYSNLTFKSNDCYMVFGCVNDERCDYGHIVWNSDDCVDNLYVHKSELCYECVDCLGCNRLLYSQECESCVDSIGLYDCRSCTNCIGCVGLKQKTYHIFNEPVTKEKYEEFLKEHPLNNSATIKMILEKRNELRKTIPQRSFFGSHNNDVSGNHIYNSHNVHHSFDIKAGENSRYGYTVRTFNESYDVSFTPDIENSYFCMSSTGSNNMFTHNCVECSYTNYSQDCFSSDNIFGCQGLRTSEYCILNKQYTKEEYENLKSKIIEHMKSVGEWGKWFPADMSAFAYNESIVNEYRPLSKEQAIEQRFRWKDNIPATRGQETVSHDELSSNSGDPDSYSDDLMKHVLKCEKCSKNYRFISRETAFYKKMKLALPRECFNCRHQRRMDLRMPRRLWPGKCANCQADVQTSYAPEKQGEFTIYCNKCYVENVG